MLEATTGGRATGSNSGGSSARRNFPAVEVFLNGNELSDLGWQGRLASWEVTEDINELNRCELVFQDPTGELSAAPLLQEGTILRIRIGYQDGDQPLVDHGTYLLQAPVHEFPDSGGQQVRIVGFGGEVVLASEGVKRRSFEDMTDSEIVTQIAQEHGFQPLVEPTDHKYRMVFQSGTDWDFIVSRAELHGFAVFVENVTLHWRRYIPRPSNEILAFRDGSESSLLSLTARINTFRHAPKVSKRQIEAQTFELLKHESEDRDDPLVQQALEQSSSVDKAADIVTRTKSRAEFVLVGSGHIQDGAEVIRQVDQVALASKWSVVELQGVSLGIETVRVGETIEVQSPVIQRFVGEYVVRNVTHSRKSNQIFRSTFTLRRSFLNKAKENPQFNEENTPDSGGGGGFSLSNGFRTESLDDTVIDFVRNNPAPLLLQDTGVVVEVSLS